MKAHVGLVRGVSRYDNVSRVLDLISDDVQLSGCQQVVVKPNFVSTSRQLASTHVDAVRAVLDFVRARYDGQVSVAEGSAFSNTWEGFERFGYFDLLERYDVTLVDLNADHAVPVQAYDRRLRLRTLHLARTVVESDYRISIGPPKTHDTVIVTLSIKNMIMGSLINPAVAVNRDRHWSSVLSMLITATPRFVRQSRIVQQLIERLSLGSPNYKLAMHQGYPIINLNLAILVPWVRPHLAVIDGFQAMEGAGPSEGDPVNWRIALAGSDTLAVDSLTTYLMGFDPAQVGYLNYCQRLGYGTGNLDRVDVLGDVDLEQVRRRFEPHPTYKQQCDWYLHSVERWLQPALQATVTPAIQ